MFKLLKSSPSWHLEVRMIGGGSDRSLVLAALEMGLNQA